MPKNTKVVKNSIWIMGGKILQMIIGLVIGLLSARYLGPSNYGVINYAGSYISFFTPVYTLGLSSILVNELLKKPEEKGAILGSSIVLRLIGSLISSALIILVVFCIHPGDDVLLIVTALQCVAIFFQWSDLFTYWCQSELNSKASVIVQLVAYILTSIYKIWLLATGKSVLWFAFSISFDYILQAIFYLFYFRKRTGQRYLFKASVAKSLFKNSYHYIFAAFGAVLYAQTDKLMLGWFFDTQEVGLYTAAVTISTMWTFILSALIDSCRPNIIQTSETDNERYKSKIIQLYSIIIYSSIFVCLVMCFASKWIVYLLYGNEYLGAVPALCVYSWSILFSYLGVARSIWCVAENKQRYEKYLTFGGALLNVVLNLIFIPLLGIAGAAIATLASQFVSNVLIAFFLHNIRENSMFILRALNPVQAKNFICEFFGRK